MAGFLQHPLPERVTAALLQSVLLLLKECGRKNAEEKDQNLPKKGKKKIDSQESPW